MAFGVTDSTVNVFYNTGNSIFSRGDGSSCCGLPNAGYTVSGSVVTSGTYQFARGDRIGIAFDVTTKNVWFSRNGSWLSGDPALGTSPTSTMSGSAPFYFVTSNYSFGTPAGSYPNTIYPNSAAMLYSPPTGFSRYDPS